MKSSIFCVVFFLFLVLGTLSKDVRPLDKALQSKLIKTLETFNAKTAEDKHNVIVSLIKLKAFNANSFENECENLVFKTSNPRDLYFNVALNLALKCSLPSETYQPAGKTIFENINTKDIEKAMYLSRALILIKGKLNSNVISLNRAKLSKAFETLSEIDRSTLKPVEAANLFTAIASLSKLIEIGKKKLLLRKLIRISKEAIFSLVAVTTKIKDPVELSHYTQAALKIAQLSRNTKYNSRNLQKIYQRLIDFVESSDKLDVNSIFNIVQAVSETKKLGKPLLFISQPTITQDKILFTVQNIFGEKENFAGKVVSATSLSSKVIAVEDADLKFDKETGSYFVPIDEEAKEQLNSPDSFEIILNFGKLEVRKYYSNEIEIEVPKADIVLNSIINGQNRIALRTSAVNGEKIDPIKFNAGSNSINIQTSIKKKGSKAPAKASQTFVRVSHKTNKKQEVIVPFNAEGGSLDVEITLKSDEDWRAVAGFYEVEIIVADSHIKNPVRWLVAELEVEYETPYQKTDEEKLYEKLPEVVHQFKPEDPREATTISFTFSVLVVVPLIIFIFVAIFYVKPGFGMLPSGVYFITTTLYQACIAGMIAVLFMYFWKWKIGKSVLYLMGLGTAAYLLATFNLRNAYKKRTAA